VKEPVWRTILCWGSVLIFLGAPVLLLALQILDHLQERDIQVAKSMSGIYLAISGVVASLAGLNTWNNIKNGK
jgi:ABC-type sulfate transport system permease component